MIEQVMTNLERILQLLSVEARVEDECAKLKQELNEIAETLTVRSLRELTNVARKLSIQGTL